jgi:TolB-like protein/Flp pilus assembly protein TadD
VAVLPFENVGESADNDHVCDGLSEEIRNALAHTGQVPVIARTSSFQFRSHCRDVREIGRLLAVTHLVEGSVRRTGEYISVTAQLIDTASGRQVWSNIYDREVDELFALQHDIALDIADHIGSVLGEQRPKSAQLRSMRASRKASPEAHQFYLRGMQLLAGTSPLPIEQAAGCFDRAIALDEEYADAWAAKGRALFCLGRPSYGHPHIPAAVYPGAIAAYRRALELEPEHPFAMGGLGVTLINHEFKWAEGMQLIRESLARNPNDAALLSTQGGLLKAMGMDGADEALNRAYRLDPFSIVPMTFFSGSLYQEGRIEDALTLIENSLIGNRDSYAPNHYAAVFNLLLGRFDAVAAHLRVLRQVAHPVDLTLDDLGWIIEYFQQETPIPWEEFWERVPNERLSYLAFHTWLPDEHAMVKAIDLAIEQRHPELFMVLFGPKPPLLPEADWERMRDITGVSHVSGLTTIA